MESTFAPVFLYVLENFVRMLKLFETLFGTTLRAIADMNRAIAYANIRGNLVL